jgi:hypothetical protein
MPVQNLDQLIKLLQDAVQGPVGKQYIVLAKALLPEAGTLVDYLALSQLQVDADDDKPVIQPETALGYVAIRGRADLFQPKDKAAVGYTVNIVCRVVQGAGGPTVTMVATATSFAPAAWTFAANFASLPKFYGTKKDEPGLVWQDSFYDDIRITQPVFTVSTVEGGDPPPGLSLVAELDPAKGTLGAHVGDYLQRQIALSGQITMRADKFPLIDLSGDTHYSISRLARVDLSLSTRDKNGEDPDSSFAGVVSTIAIGSLPTLSIAGPVMEGATIWVLTITIANPTDYTLADGVTSLLGFIGAKDVQLSLPAGIDALASMYLASATVGIVMEKGKPSIGLIGFSVKYSKDWPLPLPGGKISDVEISWSVADPFDAYFLTGMISGAFVISDESPTRLALADPAADLIKLAARADISASKGATIPSVVITAVLDQPKDQPAAIDAIVKHFSGFDPGLGVEVTALSLEIDTGERTLLFYGAIQTDLSIIIPQIKLTGASFGVHVTPNSVTGSLGAGFAIGNLPLAVSADYRGAGAGWLLKGGVAPPGASNFTLANAAFADASTPAVLGASSSLPTLGQWLTSVDAGRFADVLGPVADIQLRGLLVSYDTSASKLDFDTTVGWAFNLGSVALDLEAQFQLAAVFKQPENQYSGKLRGTVHVDALALSVIYSFDVLGNKTYTFALEYKSRTLTAVLSKNKAGEQILTVAIGNVSFGDILEYLLTLVDGGSDFRLSSPWDVLYDISFNNLSLVINLDTREIGITYRADLNLGIVNIKTIGLTYVNRAGTRTVDISITGRFVDQDYTEADPLSWDLLNDPPPSPPGKGKQLLDLRYLGLGQNVTFRDARTFNTVLEVIKALEADFTEVDGKDGNPLAKLPAIRFSGDGNWLIGADFTLMETVSLAGVFNDPVLYGLRVALAGDKAKSLAGLAFEILYKKVTDDIGVYLIKLKLPDAMRQLELGAASITLPNIALEIYTNGNFRVDAGFPVGTDFSGSFSLQLFPFVGFGGFYFALLDGQTSRTVPKITNGNFSPVIEFGLGLSIGVGKTIDKGVLKAGATLAVTGILEGTVAWFNPNDRATPSDMFLRVRGSVALVGKLFGEVNFVIIQVRIDVTATAAATILLESYQPTEVELSLTVEVSASLKILFITVHFSFALDLDLAFTIGHASTPPWAIAGGGESERPHLLLSQRTGYRPRRMKAAQLLAAMRRESGEQVTFDWTATSGPANGPIEIDIIIAPSVTVAESETVHARATVGGAGNNLEIVLPLYIRNGISPDASTAAEVQDASEDDADAPFNQLVAAVLGWTIGALKTEQDSAVFGAAPKGSVTIVHLQEIADYLAEPANRQASFTYKAVADFLAENFVLKVSSPLGATGPAHAYAAALGAPKKTSQGTAVGAKVSTTIFPMIPALTMTPQGRETVDFATHHEVTQDYVDALQAYFNELTNNATRDTAGEAGQGAQGAQTGPVGLAGAPNPPIGSMAQVIFESYFAMLASGVTREAITLMNAYPYRVTADDSLAKISQAFGGLHFEVSAREGETLEHIAGRFGVSLAAVRRANDWTGLLASHHKLGAGANVTVPVGVSVETIAAANADYPLARGMTLGVQNVRYQVGTGDSLQGVADRFGVKDVRSLFKPVKDPTSPTGLTGNPNVASPTLLAPGANIWLAPGAGPTGATFGPTFAYRVDQTDLVGPSGAAAGRLAARYTVRNQTDFDWPFLDWYRQRLVDLNSGVVWSQLAPGATVTAPVAGLTGGAIVQTGDSVYGYKQGDSIDLLAAYLAVQQIGGQAPEIAQAWAYYQQFLGRIQPQSGIRVGQDIVLPGFSRTLQPGDTLVNLAERFAAQAPSGQMGPQGLAWANRAAATLLQPLSVVALPTLDYFTGYGADPSTLAQVAQRYNLTMDELADALAEDVGIFQPSGATAGPMMTIPDVASRDIGDLTQDLIKFGRTNRIGAMVSRFLMNGLRVARPTGPQAGFGATEETKLWGLYEMIGQQVSAPKSLTAGYEVTFAKGVTADWIQFARTPVGARAAGPASPGTSEALASLALGFTSGYFADAAPSPTFSPQILRGPSAAPLYDETPVHYGLQKSLHWQAPAPVAMPGPTGPTAPITGEPTLWPFPDALNAQIAGALQARGPTAQTRPYEVTIARPGAGPRALQRYAWGSAVPFRIRRQGSGGQGGGTSYLLLGADENGRDTLLQAWMYLATASQPSDTLSLLYAPDPTSGNPQGLASTKIAPDQTFVLKSNLSTVTHSGALVAAVAGGAALDYVAPLSTPGAFLKLLWEASITASGGYYLNYATVDGAGLPDSLFANGDEAEVWLLLMLGAQSSSRPSRGLCTFNNCAVVGENVISTGADLWVQLDPVYATPADLVRVANVPAGSVAFELTRRDPTPGMSGASGPLNPRQQSDLTRSLYSLLGYAVAENAYFANSNEAVPIPPAPPGPTAPTGVWTYRQTAPISTVGLANAAPSSVALPDAAANPYRGITGPRGVTGPASQATLRFQFHDVFGNQMVSQEPIPPLNATLGYTDPLIGVGSWPGAAFDFAFRPGAGGPELDAVLSFQTDRYIAGSGLSFAQASQSALADGERYRQIFYQVQQTDVGFALSSNLGDVALAGDALKAPMTAFVTKAKLFADAAGKLSPVSDQTTAGQTLAAFALAHSTTLSALVTANAAVDARSLFSEPVVMPRVVGAAALSSLRQLVIGQNSSGEGISCASNLGAPRGPRGVRGVRVAARGAEAAARGAPVAASTPLTVQELAANNLDVPLQPGLILRTAMRTSKLAGGLPAAQRSLNAVAAALRSPVYNLVRNPNFDPTDPTGDQTIEVGILVDNQADTILTAGVPLEMTVQGQAFTVVTGPGLDTLEKLFKAFQAKVVGLALPIKLGEFAAAIAATGNLVADQATIKHAAFTVPAPDSTGSATGQPSFALADLPTAVGPIADLATMNQATLGFFATGAPLFINYTCRDPQDGETLAGLAELAQVAETVWARYNAGAVLNGLVKLQIPMLTQWELADRALAYAGYAPDSQSSLSSIGTLFGLGATGAAAIAGINRQVPGVFADGAVVAGATARAMDSLQSLWSRLTERYPTFDGFVSAIAEKDGVYRQNGVIAAPLPKIPGPKSPSWNDLAKAFGIGEEGGASGARRLAGVNQSLKGFLRTGATIVPPAGATGLKPVTVGAFDTISTVFQGFSAAFSAAYPGATISLDGLVAANAATPDINTADSPFLLPPGATPLSSAFAPVIPPRGATSAQARFIFPCHVDMQVSRDIGLVPPDFQGATAVFEASSPLVARGVAEGSDTFLLDSFAEAFEAAFIDQKLKAAVSKRHGIAADASDRAHIWAVNFGPTGVRNFGVKANDPQFYALAPLSTESLSGTVVVRDYVSGLGLGPTASRRFEEVDLDGWMQQLLNAVDVYLTPAYAVPSAWQTTGGQKASSQAPDVRSVQVSGPIGFANAGVVTGDASLTPEPGFPAVAASLTASQGARDFNAIVGAKAKLAQGLRGNVSSILDVAGATFGPWAEAARETLYQQMLTTLSTAYSVDAIIQYPVGVTGYFSSHDKLLPPRVSGKVVPQSPAVPADTPTIEAISADAQVSAPFYAAQLLDARGVWKTGASVDYPASGKLPYTITPTDTLRSIADYFCVATEPGALDYWSKWRAFIAPPGGIGAQSLLNGGAALPIVVANRTVNPGDSLSLMAGFFGVDVGTLAEAVSDYPGIFLSSYGIVLDGKKAPATPQSSLDDVAAALGATVRTLVERATIENPPPGPNTLRKAAVLATGKPFSFVFLAPDLTLSTAKVSLAPEAGKPPHLTFLMHVDHEARYKKLFLNLKYVINEIEFDIRDVEQAGDYRPSSWLSFILPIGSGRGFDQGVDTDIGQVQAPLPLRSYPTPPLLVGQAAAVSNPQANTIPKARQWDYRFDFETRNADQDTNHVELAFNRAPSTNGDLAISDPTKARLLRALAQFVTVWPELKQDLAQLTGLPYATQNNAAAVAVSTLRTLAEGVANAFSNFGDALGQQWPTETYAYRLLTGIDPNAQTLRDVTFVPEVPLGMSAMGPTLWPDSVFLKSPTAPTGPGPDSGFVELAKAGAGYYLYPPGLSADQRTTLRLLYRERDIIRNKSVWSGVYVARNESLIANGPLGPRGMTGAVATRPEFIYRTPMVRFVDALTPFVANSSVIDVNGLTGPVPPAAKRPLSGHLTNLIDAVLELQPWSPVFAESVLQLLVSYSFALAGDGPDSLVATVPIRLVPMRSITPASRDALVAELSADVKQWRQTNQPSGAAAYLGFDASVFIETPLPGGDGFVQKPILRLDTLILPIDAIDWT